MWMSGCELIEYARVVRHFQYRGKERVRSFKAICVHKSTTTKNKEEEKSLGQNIEEFE